MGAGFTIPNAASAFAVNMGEVHESDIDTLVGGFDRRGVIKGAANECAVTYGGSGMGCTVASGVVRSGGLEFTVTTGTVTLDNGDGTNPRYDLIVVSSAGTKTFRKGTAAANPTKPTPSTGDVILAEVWVPAGATVTANDRITDKRILIREELYNSLFNVRVYGALGDGANDDTAEIQAAIDACNAAGGGVVHLPRGVYLTSDDLTLKSNVTLEGTGNLTIIRQTVTAKHGIKTAASTTATLNVGIRNLHVQAGHATCGMGIKIASARNVRVHNIWIDGQTANTHRWEVGFAVDDEATSNKGSFDVKVSDFYITDIGATAGHTGLWVWADSESGEGTGGYQFTRGTIVSDYYSDNAQTALTTMGDCGILVERGWNVTFSQVYCTGFKYGATVAGSADGAHIRRAGASSPYVRFNECHITVAWTVPGAGQAALRVRSTVAGLTYTNGTLACGNPSGVGAVDIDATVATGTDAFNSIYIGFNNINGGVRVDNSVPLTQDQMGPIKFAFNNFHGALAGTQIVSGPHKISFIGNEYWNCTTGIDIGSGSGALSLQIEDNRFYGCTTNINIDAGHTGSRNDWVIRGNSPDSVNFRYRVTTASGTQATLSTYTIAASTTITLRARVAARRTGGGLGAAEDGAAYGRTATFKNVAGVATQIGATFDEYTHESQGGWDCVFDVTGATARVRVTGAGSNDVSWQGEIDVIAVST